MDVLEPLSAAAGVRNPGIGGLGGEPYLDICPPRLQFPDIADLPEVIPLRPVEIEAPADAGFEAWLARRDRAATRLSDDGHGLQRGRARAVRSSRRSSAPMSMSW